MSSNITFNTKTLTSTHSPKEATTNRTLPRIPPSVFTGCTGGAIGSFLDRTSVRKLSCTNRTMSIQSKSLAEQTLKTELAQEVENTYSFFREKFLTHQKFPEISQALEQFRRKANQSIRRLTHDNYNTVLGILSERAALLYLDLLRPELLGQEAHLSADQHSLPRLLSPLLDLTIRIEEALSSEENTKKTKLIEIEQTLCNKERFMLANMLHEHMRTFSMNIHTNFHALLSKNRFDEALVIALEINDINTWVGQFLIRSYLAHKIYFHHQTNRFNNEEYEQLLKMIQLITNDYHTECKKSIIKQILDIRLQPLLRNNHFEEALAIVEQLGQKMKIDLTPTLLDIYKANVTFLVNNENFKKAIELIKNAPLPDWERDALIDESLKIHLKQLLDENNINQALSIAIQVAKDTQSIPIILEEILIQQLQPLLDQNKFDEALMRATLVSEEIGMRMDMLNRILRQKASFLIDNHNLQGALATIEATTPADYSTLHWSFNREVSIICITQALGKESPNTYACILDNTPLNELAWTRALCKRSKPDLTR